ncbi:hypothetical protein AWM70_03240 [Paenibacillus yonginensis]|uniref:Dit-like phage tail protein N-terminal domain-containing protein n=1 Tax=Paenibacillus yonginensis TaxID=1462996 RepID=A0A1B1MX28_9BACL|nr:hypothetical protein [Paenibacillus yonginensis]ANS73709.1 hypothetical protein AWM70_03240 [Paenibacillus yonginensis]
MAKIDGRYILVEKEDLTFDVEITQQPVERSIDLTDHVQRKARSLSISGLVVDDPAGGYKAAEIHRYLVECQEGGKIVDFTGRTTIHGLLSGLSTSRDYTVADGFTFSVTITEVLIANASKGGAVSAQLKPQTQEVKSAGFKQPKNNKKTPGNIVNSNLVQSPKMGTNQAQSPMKSSKWEEDS